MTDKKEVETTESKGFDFNKAFQTDTEKELDGSWTTISMGGEEMKIMLARKDNTKAQSYLRALLRINEHRLKANDDKANLLFMDLRRKVIARCIILDWDGVIIDDNIIPYDEKTCVKLLKFVDFFELVESASGDMEIFRAESNAKILGN